MINDCNGGISNRPDGEIRRFSPVYKQSLEQIEMSEELRSRILSTVPAIASKNPKKQWIKAAGGLAACLVAVVAAGSLVPRMEFSLTVEDNAACETVSSAAATAEAPPIGVSGDGEASPEGPRRDSRFRIRGGGDRQRDAGGTAGDGRRAGGGKQPGYGQ